MKKIKRLFKLLFKRKNYDEKIQDSIKEIFLMCMTPYM